MSSIKLITDFDIENSVAICYFGWQPEELVSLTKQYQSKYYGSVNDACFEIIDEAGVAYYAIFRTAAEDEWVVRKSKDYLLFKDQNRVLLNIGGKLYRYSIKERKVLDNTCYEGIFCNDIDEPISRYFHSISSVQHEVMIVVDQAGIAAINWDGILWRHNFESAAYGYLELLSISENKIIAKYDNAPMGGGLYAISFDLETGNYEMKPSN